MTATPIRVRSAGDLIRGLESSDAGLQLAMLEAVARDPVRALRYGRDGDRDVVDAVLDLLARTRTAPRAEAYLEVLCRFDDPRVTAECRRRFALPGSPALKRRAALALAERDPAEARRYLLPWLHQHRDPVRARFVAEALAPLPDLSEMDRIRIAAAAPEAELAVPALDAATAMHWLAELSGPFGDGARLRLMAQGLPAYEELARRWDELGLEERSWLLDWGTRGHPLEVVGLLKRAITAEDEALTLQALELLPALGPAAAWFGPLLERFTEHAEPRLLAAAIRAGRRGLDWRRLIAASVHRRVRLAAIGCLAEAEGHAALPDLVPLLADPDWRIRAAASRAVGSLGEAGAEAARPLLDDPREGVREAVAQVLVSTSR